MDHGLKIVQNMFLLFKKNALKDYQYYQWVLIVVVIHYCFSIDIVNVHNTVCTRSVIIMVSRIPA